MGKAMKRFSGSLVLIDDDTDDRDMMTEVLNELGVGEQVRMFENPRVALEYLKHTPEKPFLIVCDINMPVMSGLQLRQALVGEDALRLKNTPFVFLSTSSLEEHIEDAYNLYAHGYFIKPTSFQATRHMFENLFTYWQSSRVPVGEN